MNASNSASFGEDLLTSSSCQTVIGKCNIEDSNNEYRFIVGNGTDITSRHNAFAVGNDNSITIGDTKLTESKLQKMLSNVSTSMQTTAPTSNINDGGIHIVYLESEPETKYSGYIYLIKESL